MSSSADLNNLKNTNDCAPKHGCNSGFSELMIKSVTHSCDGGSSLGVIKVWSGENTTSSFFESVTAGCGASIIIELRIWKHSQCVARAPAIHTSGESGLSLTLSSALRRISLSGKAPSRGIHSSRTSCGLERSCLTGTTRAPIGWSHALDSYTGRERRKGKR